MKSIRVVPNDGGWKVMTARANNLNHSTKARYDTKQKAVDKARRMGNSGDVLTKIKSDGAIQSKVTLQ